MSTTGQLRADLVFEGGGVKGIAFAGAYRELTDRGYQAECVAGTSAGAITAALIAVGYSGAEVEDIALRHTHFKDFEDRTFLDELGRPGQMAEFFIRRGMHSGESFLAWMRRLLASKGKTTFGDLRNPSESDPSRAYRLQVVASDVTARSMLVLPRDAAALGIDDPDELGIAEAVRMSMSIPVFFEPVVVKHRKTGQDHVIVDGGLRSNYPIWLFDAPGFAPPRFPTFGMILVTPDEQSAPGQPADAVHPVMDSDVTFLKAVVSTMLQAHDRFHVDHANFVRTIRIPTLGVGTTEFDISPERSQALFDSGRAAVAKFLDSWDFDAYKQQFRS
ncbi:MAG: patatin-like phospholipase family protein [Solirubrobacteraceae bacterium]